MPETTVTDSSSTESYEPVLSWRVHPAGERKGLAILISILIAVLGMVASFWMANIYWGIFAIVLLFLSLEAFFLPSRFELSEKGIRLHKAFSHMERPWGHFRRMSIDSSGVTLSPFRKRNWLDSYRATRLTFAYGGAQVDPAPQEIYDFILGRIDTEAVLIEGLAQAGATSENKTEND